MDFLLSQLIIALVFTSLASLLIGVFVLFKGRKGKTNRIFALYSFSIAWWALFQAIVNASTSQEIADFLGKVSLVGTWMIPTFFMHFTISFLNLRGKERLLRFGYGISFIFIFLSLTTAEVISEMAQIFYLRHWIVPGPIFHFAFAYFIIAVAYSLYELFKSYKKSNGRMKNQIGYLLWPSLFGYIGGVSNFFYSYDIHIPILMPFGTYFVVAYVISIAYAILKYQLMDIRILAQKTLFYSIGVAMASGIIIGISFVSNWLSQNIAGFKIWIIPLVAGVAAFIVGDIFYRKSKQVEKSYGVEKKALDEIKRLSDIKDQFILATQHHLRTPLSIARGYLSTVVESGKIDRESMENLKKALNSINKLTSLVNELLNLTQLEVGKEPINIHLINVKGIIDSIVRGLKPEIDDKGLWIKVIPEKGWLNIQADYKKIEIVLLNLIDNAVKYTKTGGIMIKGRKVGNYFEISIKDTGIGIDSQETKTMFDKYFERGEKARKLHVTGRGIGLHVASSIIKEHKGKIYARSDGINKGSEFLIELPIMQD